MKNVVITVKLFCLDSGKIELFFYTKIGLQNESLVELFEGVDEKENVVII